MITFNDVSQHNTIIMILYYYYTALVSFLPICDVIVNFVYLAYSHLINCTHLRPLKSL